MSVEDGKEGNKNRYEKKFDPIKNKLGEVETKVPKRKWLGTVHEEPKEKLDKKVTRIMKREKVIKSDHESQLAHGSLTEKDCEDYRNARDKCLDREDEVREKIEDRKDTFLEKVIDTAKDVAKRPPRLPKLD